MKAFRLGCIMAMVMAGATFLTTFASAAEPIKLGVYLPLTGDNAFGGQLELEGVELAFSQFPTIIGRPVELKVVDNKSDKIEAANAATRLIERDKVTGLIGSYGSSLAMAAGEIAEEAGIPMIGTSCTNPLVTQGKKYSFRACFIDPYQGAGAATYAIRVRGYKNAALLTDVSNDYAVGLSKFFRQSFQRLGGEIVAALSYQSGDQDFTAQLTEIISKKPDVVFMPAYFAQGSIIMKQARELGGGFVLMGGDAMDNPDTVKIAGKAAEGFLQTTFPYSINMPKMSPEAEAFTAAWKKQFPHKDPNVNAALGYNCYLMFKSAIERAGTDDPEKVTAALAATKNLPTPLGILNLNDTHDAEMPVGITEIRNGKSVYLGEIVPE